MASVSYNIVEKERKPMLISAEILKEAEKYGYPVEQFKAKIPEFTSPGPLPAYTEIIKCTEAILSTQERLNKIRGEIACYNLCNPYMATHPTLIEKKVTKLMDELHRVRAVIEFQTQIQASLQTFNLQSSLPIRTKHHKAVLGLLLIMPKMINEVKENIDNLEWFLMFQPNRNIEKISTAVTQTFSQLQCTSKQLREFYGILKKLHCIRIDDTAASNEKEQSHVERSPVRDWKYPKRFNNKLTESPYFSTYIKKKSSKKQ